MSEIPPPSRGPLAAGPQPAGRPVLVTGAAGFLGFHAARRLLAAGQRVDGLDAFVGAADPALQQARWQALCAEPGFRGTRLDLRDRAALVDWIGPHAPQRVLHLAARVGVRDSVRRPDDYLEGNLTAFLNLLEALRGSDVGHLVYASSSSVYGDGGDGPAREEEAADRPVSFYAATKRSMELMAHAWAALHGIPSTGLRFFTVYGPWGRPEMAVSRFVRAVEAGEEIRLYDGGAMERDFTYVDDAVDAALAVLERPPQPADPARVLNVGGGRPVSVLELLRTVEQVCGRRARVRILPRQPGDVTRTWADPARLERAIGFRPATALADGVARTVAWHRDRARAAAPAAEAGGGITPPARRAQSSSP